jgi:molybdopterin molybdotransferase
MDEKVKLEKDTERYTDERYSIEKCRELLLKEIKQQNKTKKLDLEKACNRVLAEDIVAGMDVPYFPKSAMDGYAVKADDCLGASKETPISLKVVGELFAGDYKEYEYKKNSTVRVMTGAYVPKGYDAVIRQEDTDFGMERVLVYSATKEYANYCKVGEDIKKGDVVIERGTRLTPEHIGILASLGIDTIEVYKKARIAIISTGSELAPIGKKLEKGKIYNSIAHMLKAKINERGLKVVGMEICPDDETLLASKLKRAVKDADVVITTGAVSVGKKDIVPKVLKDIGAKKLFKGALIQPGTPTMASILKGKPILSLSGNPYAALANFEIYFWSMMAKFMNSSDFDIKTGKAVLKSEYKKQNRMRRLVRAYAKEGQVRLPSDIHASSVIHNLTECNCMIDLEAGRSVNVGDEVNIIYF